MNIGVVSRSFPQLSNEEVAKLLSNNNFRSTELCFSQTDSDYWVYNGRSELNDLSNEKSKTIVETYRQRDIEVTAIGVFTNLLEPDEKESEKNLAYFERLMEIAAINNVPYVSTECGFISGRRGINADTYEVDFERFVENIKWLVVKAEKHNVTIALEPCVLDVVPSAKRMSDLIEMIGSERLKVLLDPANLIANNTEEEMFSYLSPHIAYFHGKDRKINDVYGRVIGDGDINWPLFLNLYHKYTEDVPFIMEYVNIDNYLDIRDRVVQFNESQIDK